MEIPRSIAFLLLVVVATVFAGAVEKEPVKVSSLIGDVPQQYEARKPEEDEGDAMADLQFERDITNDGLEDVPLPSLDKVRELYRSKFDEVAEEAKLAGDDSVSKAGLVTINPVFQYYSLEAWQKPILKCCPRVWNYQCRSSWVRLPCFSHYNNGWERCCPIWPSVYIRRCLCSQCAVLTSTCAHEGRCRARYIRKGFLAVCYKNHQWGFLRYIRKWLPNSCYCRI